MAKGKASVNYLHREGLVGHQDAPDWSFIYSTSLVKDSKWNIGDRCVLPDGREFRYAKSTEALITPLCCNFTLDGAIAYTSAVIPAAIGDTKVVVPAATHDALTEDELRGGYLTIFKAGVVQFRGIIGNPAVAADVAVTLYLDGPLDATVTTSSAYEVWANPWSALEQNAGSANGKAGTPAVAVAAALSYFWCQIRGPIFINPQSTVVDKEGTGVMWRADGSLEAVATAIGGTVPADDTSQYAGFRMGGSATGNGPLFMMQG